MAARRLIILMLILLGISTLAAALVPTPDRDREDTETTATTAGTDATATEEAAPAPSDQPEGTQLQARIEIGAGKIPVVPVELGDALTLEVRSDRRGLVEIPALGRVEAVSPETPAFFYLLPRTEASYGIRFLGSDRVVARIEVEPRKTR